MRLLVVEDDPMVGDGLSSGLSKLGFTVDLVTDGQSADTALRADRFDCVVLDLGLPKISGLEVLRAMRIRDDRTPVIILTAQDTIDHKVQGLDLGADDYLEKPFALKELAARVRALIRRSHGRASPLLRVGDLEIHPESKKVLYSGKQIDIRGIEYKILEYLTERNGTIVSKEKLEALVYGWDGGTESNSLEVHIHNLRKKLTKDFIVTIRGSGYTINAPEGS